ncbi:MAG TPA: hypothetical protein VNA14_06650 [Mycobacteriales bacterium]|nr:hypothetical protein [Mycobacteriales bacterium]
MSDFELVGPIVEEGWRRSVAGEPHATVMAGAIDRLADWRTSPVWQKLRAVDWAEDVAGSARWLEELLRTYPPPGDVTGLWFGLFRPIREGRTLSDFYVSGSRTAPRPDWGCDADWWTETRYRHSPALTAAANLEPSDDTDLAWTIDYGLGLLHLASTVVQLLPLVPKELWLGEAGSRYIALGHDSGEQNDVAVIDRTGSRITTDTIG